MAKKTELNHKGEDISNKWFVVWQGDDARVLAAEDDDYPGRYHISAEKLEKDRLGNDCWVQANGHIDSNLNKYGLQESVVGKMVEDLIKKKLQP